LKLPDDLDPESSGGQSSSHLGRGLIPLKINDLYPMITMYLQCFLEAIEAQFRYVYNEVTNTEMRNEFRKM